MKHNVMDRLHDLLAQLTLVQADTMLESMLEQAAKEQPAYADFLLEVLTTEKEFRTTRVMQTRIRMANLPYAKTLAQFDFSFQPSIDERQVKELQTLRFIAESGNVIHARPYVKRVPLSKLVMIVMIIIPITIIIAIMKKIRTAFQVIL